ncbi:TsoY family (seleno)protein [Halothiobacillus sp.]|uniref:TsoY family (seleno)protein n=1 Tax=Halothiobacillus sp. TaxID=1891311 RepID=UPI003D12DDB4
MLVRDIGSKFTPLYFLASLGAGGLAVSFFIYLMFLLPHPNTAMVTFGDVWPILTGPSLFNALLTGLAISSILFFAYWHFRLLFWNIREFGLFKQTDAYQKLLVSNSEIALMTIPLTLAMTVNVSFVLGALLIPNLWSIVEWLFPLAISAFFVIGVFAMKILVRYFSRALVGGNVDFATNNSLAPMVSIFALSMIAVGFAAPASMSKITTVIAISIALSLFFMTIAVLLAIVKLVNGFQSMMINGISESASPSLWIMIPILTLLGISWIRLSHGLHHGFDSSLHYSGLFVGSMVVVSAQILFGLLGYAVMRHLGYFKQYIHGEKGDAGTFALVCPGVAFFVFGMFFINVGLTHNDIITHRSWVYFLLMAPFVYVQLKTVQVFWKLKNKLLTRRSNLLEQPATPHS